jgi:YHS domain-containing protein
MNERTRCSGTVLLAVVVALASLAVLVAFSGCGRRQPPAHEHHEGHDHASMAAPATQAAVAEQTTCPIMGSAINKAIFVEYKGEKVYFCCKGCDKVFLENPEQYVAKLPQFQK